MTFLASCHPCDWSLPSKFNWINIGDSKSVVGLPQIHAWAPAVPTSEQTYDQETGMELSKVVATLHAVHFFRACIASARGTRFCCYRSWSRRFSQAVAVGGVCRYPHGYLLCGTLPFTGQSAWTGTLGLSLTLTLA
jgi:hypothetical protein